MRLENYRISKTVRQYWKEVGYEPTPGEWAIFVWGDRTLSLQRKIDLLEEVNKEADPVLKQKLDTHLGNERRFLERFADNHDNRCIYTVFKMEYSDSGYDNVCFTMDYKYAVDFMNNDIKKEKDDPDDDKCLNYRIEKNILLSDAGYSEDGCFVAVIAYDENGIMQYHHSCEDPMFSFMMDDEPDFLSSYVEMPLPFKDDLVPVYKDNDPDQEIGLARSLNMDEEREKRLIEHYVKEGCFLDNSVTVEWLCESDDRDTFSHDHENPLHLEIADPDNLPEIVRCAIDLVRGETTIESFLMYCEHCV